jgi:hypothetical protein
LVYGTGRQADHEMKNGVLEEIVSVVFDKLKLMLFTGWETLRETGDPSTSIVDYIKKLKFEGKEQDID